MNRLPFTKYASKALNEGREIAGYLGFKDVSSIFVLLGLYGADGSLASEVLKMHGVTSKIEKKRKQPTHFFLRKAKGLAKPSMVLAEQLDTCDKICVIRYLGRVSKGQMRGIDEAVRIQLGYYIPEQAEKKRQGKCRKEGEEGAATRRTIPKNDPVTQFSHR